MKRDRLRVVRTEIDAVDRELVALMARRKQLVERAARIKRHARNVVDADRNEAVLDNVRAAALRYGLPPGFAERVWRLMTELWIRHQVRMLCDPEEAVLDEQPG